MKRKLTLILISFAVIILIVMIVLQQLVKIEPPTVNYVDVDALKVEEIDDSLWVCNNSWLHHSKSGLYEMYTEGEAYTRGLTAGKLSQDLIYKQERAFVDRINQLIPSRFYLRVLNFIINLFNRNIDTYIKPEYLQEIYGVSQYSSDVFDNIGTKYQRILSYHAAHDIGHMLQNYNLVGCTSFAAWDKNSADTGLIIGRNFDFYVGDKFAEDKIVSFINPDSGYNFMMITWGGMCGVVSGMNEQGLTVTINAAKSDIPMHIATPISLVARHILQYASNHKEAVKIANAYTSFVSESFLIGSAIDNSAIIIEKNPNRSDIVTSDSAYLVCTNHFQGDKFKNDPQNIAQQKETPTLARYNRTKELLKANIPLNITSTAAILRNPYGLHNKKIGYTNEMTVNQYVAHHSIIFKPEKLLVWVSTSPYQLGKYVCYDLRKIFDREVSPAKSDEIYENNLSLPADWSLVKDYYSKVPAFKRLREILLYHIHHKSPKVEESLLSGFIESNPDYYQVYSLIGDYYFSIKEYEKALPYYNIAVGKQIPFVSEKQEIISRISECGQEIRK